MIIGMGLQEGFVSLVSYTILGFCWLAAARFLEGSLGFQVPQ